MNAPATQALLTAVTALVTSPNAKDMFAAMQAVARVPTGTPVALTGWAAVAQPILDLQNTDPAAYRRVMELVDVKRTAQGLAPLLEQAGGEFDKTAYMREFMDQKRQRQRRAATIENMTRPARDALRGRARLDFMDVVAAAWKQDLDARIQKSREAAGGHLDKETLTLLRSQFWATVDAGLDRAEEQARDKIRGRK